MVTMSVQGRGSLKKLTLNERSHASKQLKASLANTQKVASAAGMKMANVVGGSQKVEVEGVEKKSIGMSINFLILLSPLGFLLTPFVSSFSLFTYPTLPCYPLPSSLSFYHPPTYFIHFFLFYLAVFSTSSLGCQVVFESH